MKLEALPAKKGDCLLLHHGSDADPKLIVVDGGPSGVYRPTLLPRLRTLRAERQAAGLIGEGDPLMIDLLIISHIDDDHINGVKALLNEMAQLAKDGGAPEFIIGRLWHNGFDSLASADNGDVNGDGITLPDSAGFTASIDAAFVATGALNAAPGGTAAHDVVMVLASVEQGHDVVKLARSLHIPINPEFGGQAIVATDRGAIDVDGLAVTVVGPLQPELDKLRAAFKQWLKARDAGTSTPASLLASFDDQSVANLSSIVLLVDDGTERYLLTGDARGDYILRGLGELGRLDHDGRMALDILKVQHHGSNRNSTTGYFESLPARRYIFSGNGEHGNPERATLSDLAAARGATPVTIELTYSPNEIDAGRDADWAKHHRHGPPFDHATQGIVPFLAAQKSFTVEYP